MLTNWLTHRLDSAFILAHWPLRQRDEWRNIVTIVLSSVLALLLSILGNLPIAARLCLSVSYTDENHAVQVCQFLAVVKSLTGKLDFL